MNISIEKYNLHCKVFNAMSVTELQNLYNDDDFMYDVNNEFNNMHNSLLLYLPQRLFKEIEKLTK